MSPASRLKARFIADGLLPTHLPRLIKRRLRGAPEFPDELFIFLTNRCNARCEHCFYIDELGDTTSEWTLADWEKAAPSLPPLEHLTITGGEALLHPEINAITRLLCRAVKPKVITVISNGLRTRDAAGFAEGWLDDPPNMDGAGVPVLDMLFSLDGMRETHDATRGIEQAWTFANETIKTIAALRDAHPGRIDTGIVTVITNRNYRELPELAQHAREHLRVRQGFEFVRGTDTSLWGLAPELRACFNPSTPSLPPIGELPAIVDTVRDLNRRAGKLANFEFFATNAIAAKMLTGDGTPALPCLSAGATTGVIYPNGDIAICEFMRPFGNLRADFDFDFAAAWRSPAAGRCRAAARHCRCTHGCYLSRNLTLTGRGLLTVLREL